MKVIPKKTFVWLNYLGSDNSVLGECREKAQVNSKSQRQESHLGLFEEYLKFSLVYSSLFDLPTNPQPATKTRHIHELPRPCYRAETLFGHCPALVPVFSSPWDTLFAVAREQLRPFCSSGAISAVGDKTVYCGSACARGGKSIPFNKQTETQNQWPLPPPHAVLYAPAS